MTKYSNSKRPSIDGFSPRAKRSSIGDFKNPRKISSASINTTNIGALENDMSLASDREIEESAFEDDAKPKKNSRKQARKDKRQQKKDKKKRNKDEKSSRKIKFVPNFLLKSPIKSSFMIVGIFILSVAGFLGGKFYFAQANIFDRNGDGAPALRSNLDPSELSGEGDGRVNIMIVGIGGEGHPGGDLADTIIIASIDPFAKEVAMLSVPRDMYVDIPDYWSTRINAAHAIGEEQDFSEPGYPEGGIGLLQKTLEETLDIPIHYYVRVDFTAFKDSVDAVGGVVLDVETAVYDPTFIWEWQALDVAVGEQYFDGERALFYARSRKTSPGGDFDRSARQREIIVALKEKVLSVGTYANPLKIAGLIDAVGNGVRTNLSISEILRLYEIAGEVPSDKIVSIGLDNGVDGLLAGQNIGGASVLVPKAGDYSEVQQFVRSIFVDGFIKSEAANVEVYNGTATEGLATEYAAELGTYGYSVVNIGNTSANNFTRSKLFVLSGDAPYTQRYLEQRVGVSVSPNSALPAELGDTTATFVIILGTDVQENYTQIHPLEPRGLQAVERRFSPSGGVLSEHWADTHSNRSGNLKQMAGLRRSAASLAGKYSVEQS